MFTGLVEHLGVLTRAESSSEGLLLQVASELACELQVGDSVAVDGVCLTATEVADSRFAAEVMHETVARSALARLTEGEQVNLELPLRVSDRLGGHIVQGHVDGVGTVVDLRSDGFARRVRVQAPEEVLRYVVVKGSIAVSGVSLTVAEINERSFTVSLIPETLERTNLSEARIGTDVNLEVDVLAKYVEKLMERAR